MPGSIGSALPYDPAWCVTVDADSSLGSPAPTSAPSDTAAATHRIGYRVAQSLFCLANGVIGTRGVLEEDPLHHKHRVRPEESPEPAVVVAAGLYEPAASVGDQLATLPPWCELPLIDGIGPGRRILDLRDGVLHREVATPAIATMRFACAARPGTSVLVAEFDVAGWAQPTVPATTQQTGSACPSGAGGGAVMASSTSFRVTGTGSTGPVVVERVATYAVSTDHMPAPSVATKQLHAARRAGPAELLAEQRQWWARRWATADVETVGDTATTRALRFALFHLLTSAGHGSESAVGARGLTGPAYAGHVLWDTEAFVLPVLAALDPEAARSVLRYRIHRLGPAGRRAAGEGRRGARFPWESAENGDDVTPRSGVDHNGHTVAIRTGDLEVHITADIAWSAWRYAAWTGDWSFLDGPGRPLVVEPARYWASRVRWGTDGRAHIDRVIGPDEYHEDVDDNAFTNLMVRWNLHRAAELLERQHRGRPSTDEAGKAVEEAAHWRQIADALVDNYDTETGLYEQFAGFNELQAIMARSLGTPPLAADLVLGHQQVAATQILKQADVLMAHHLIPEGTAAGSLEPNLEFYLPRTAHGSSLSPAVHASLLARVGRSQEAVELLCVAAAVDLDDLTQTTAGGLHLANLGGLWQAVVHGFAGITVHNPSDTALRIDPRLPDAWPELRLALGWHGRQLHLTCANDRVHVACDRPVRVMVHGTATAVEPPGRWIG